MKEYTIEIQHCMEVKVQAESPEEARMILIENVDRWEEEFCNSATIHNPIKEEEIERP